MRTADGIGLVERQARLPLPPRLYQRQRARPGTAETAYVREDRILPHLPALYLLLTGPATETRRRRTRRGADIRHQPAERVIGYLREQQITLAYDPAERTLCAGTGEAAQTITPKAS